MWPNLVLLLLVLAIVYRRPLWHKCLKPWLARHLRDATLNTASAQRPTTTHAATMSVAQALEILGVDAHANQEAIILAHKRLIQKLHPDRGGNAYLATQVNIAKQILLNQFKAG
jgi:hypothetical protein